MKKRNFKRVVAAALMSLVLTMAVWGLGVFLGQLFPSFDARPLLGILAVAFVLSCGANRVAAKIFARNHFGMPPEERRALLATYMEECKQDPAAVLKRFSDVETVPVLVLSVYFLLTLALGVAGGLCYSHMHTILGALVCYALLYMPLVRLLELIPSGLNQEALVPENQLPILHALAQKAMDTVELKGHIRIEITRECDCDVNRIGRTFVVFLGTRLLTVLDEEELFQCLLMAFEKFARPSLNRQIMRRYRLGMLGGAEIRKETFAFDLFFSYADAYMEWEYDLYLRAMRRYLERCGYERVRKDGNARAAVRALAKKAMWKCFVFEYVHFNSTPFYQEPTPPTHVEERICREFLGASRQRNRSWMKILERELRRPGEEFALFREERELLISSEDALDLVYIDDTLVVDTAYGREVMQAIREEADRRITPEIAKSYDRERAREYLEPLRVAEEYEASPDGYTTPELSPVINAYRELGRFGKAEALCDAILERETNPFAMAHAIYFKGMCMLHRYETEGIDHIYRAIDLNKNYMKDGFELVEDYCLRCGLTDEYEAFLRRADVQFSAHAYNQEGAAYLVATDRLEPEKELGDMLPDILSYMERVSEGCIRQVYLVRKVVSEDFFTSAFVVNFEYGTSEEQMRKTYVAIFNYLDAYPVDWQFSLFTYDRETERAVNRVVGSLVWEKK